MSTGLKMRSRRPKTLGIIGDPVSHSLSPLMHNAALAQLRLPYVYQPFLVRGDFLKHFLNSIHKRQITGLNVTIPHKQPVIPHLDSLSPEAKRMGAVNTIVVKGKKLTGHNTDGAGFIMALQKEARFNAQGKKVILLGAGGAARGIAVALASRGAKEIHVVNRTPARAQELVAQLRKKFPKTRWGANPMGPFDRNAWSGADLLVNSTAMGMKGEINPLPLKLLPKKALVTDIVYTPLLTSLLRQAQKLKLKTLPGWGMLLYQGVLAFELWTHRKAPVGVMKKTLLEALGEK